MTGSSATGARRPRVDALIAMVLLASAGCGSTVPAGDAQRTGSPQAGGGLSDGVAVGTPKGSVAGPSGTDLTAGSRSTPASAGPTVRSAPQGVPAAAAAGAIPPRGHGWDEHNVYIGVPTQEDVSSYASTAGFHYNEGSVRADVDAIVKDLNARGGLFGRRIVAVFHDNKSADIAADANSATEGTCTKFTQDSRVLVVVNAKLPDSDSWRACLQRSRTSLLSRFPALWDDSILRAYGPNLWSTLWPSVTPFVPAWLDRLQVQGYFAGWNTSVGEPGEGKARVGILEPDTSVGQRTAAAIQVQLRERGIEVAATYSYADSTSSYGSQMPAAVLRFATAGVTHVLTVPAVPLPWLMFMNAAESQRYRPRYALNSWMYPTPTKECCNPPLAQLRGSVGIGWAPTYDVATPQLPPVTQAQGRCLAIMGRAGVSLPNTSSRGLAFSLCDGFGLLVAGAQAAGGLTQVHLRQGISRLAPRLPMAATFGNRPSTGDQAQPGVSRDIAYQEGCSCFAYRGSTHLL